MKLNGHEIKYMRTVLANCEIAKICENRDIANFEKMLQGSTVDSIKAQVTFIIALQRGWEMHEKFENPDYEPHYLTEEELMLVEQDTLTQMFTEAAKVYSGDAEQEVETQPPKGSKKNTGKTTE